MKIYVVENFCDCNLCKGHRTVRTLLDMEAFLASRNKGMKSQVIGGRHPKLIVFNAEALYVGNVSTTGRISITDPITEESLHLGLCGEKVFSDKDSIHGCWKIIENQRFQLYLRPEYYDEKVEIAYTRRQP